MKVISKIVLVSLCLSSTAVLAKVNVNVESFAGEYSLVASDGGDCSSSIKIISACNGVKVLTVLQDGRTMERESMCNIDKGTSRDLSRGGGGHAIFPSLDYTKTVVTSNAAENSISKIEKETSVSLGIFSSELSTTLKMENENQLLLTIALTTNASDRTEVFCSYMRK